MGKLSPKQKRFVEEYILCRSGAEAAKAAGYAPGSAHVTGSRLLANAKIAKAINDGIRDASEKASRTAVDAINDITRLARLAEESGDLKTAIRGFELEAKHHGGFIERKADVLTSGEDAPKEIVVKFVDVNDE